MARIIVVCAAAACACLRAAVAFAPSPTTAPARLATRRPPATRRTPLATRRRLPPLRSESSDDEFDFDEAFKARLEDADVQQLIKAPKKALDMVKMAIVGREAVAVAVAAIVGALALLSTGIFFAGSKSPLKEVVVEDVAPGVCITGRCAGGATQVKALEFTTEGNAQIRKDAREANPEPFLE